MKPKILLAAALVLVLCGLVYWQWKKPTHLRDSDSLLVGEFVNASGDPNFDGSLREALRVALNQSPYLKLVSDEKVRTVLRGMGKPDGERLSAVISRELCGRLGAKAYLTGTISKASMGYAIELEADGCPEGERMARETDTASRADLVIHHLGLISALLREDLGEKKESIKKFDFPLERATTPIPAAMKAYEDARKATREKGDLEALPFYKKAIDLDSRFALARSGLAVCYYNLNQMALAGEQIRAAYEAADRQTVREHLNVTTLYYDLSQGDTEKAIAGYKEYLRTYPRDDVAMGNLSSEFFVVGDYEQAAHYAEEALSIDPDSAAWYENYSTALLALSRLDEAEKVLKEAFSRKMDDAALHSNMYSLAFLKGDTTLMQHELAWAENKPNGEDSILAAQSDTEAYFGRMKKAREYTRRAVASAEKSELPESAAIWEVEAGLREAMFGNAEEARKAAEAGLKFSPDSKDVRAVAALIFARTGDQAKAQSIMDDLRALYVSNMVMQKAWLPVVRAQMAMRKNRSAEAIQQLEIVTPYEKGQLTGNLSDSCMIPVYLRGEALLNAQRGGAAMKEFQKIEASGGIIGNCWSGPLARLGVARCEAAAGSLADARSGYQKFLELWKDADADIPVFKQAKAEAAKLH